MDNKLRPCPFCGSTTAPSLLRGDEITECDENEHSDSWAMVCDAHNGGCGAAAGYHVNPDSAVHKWNGRAELAARGPVLSSLELIALSAAIDAVNLLKGQQPTIAGIAHYDAVESELITLLERAKR